MSISKSGSRIWMFIGGLWPRVPILHRYVGRELIVVALLTTMLLTALMALCGVLKPLRQHGITAPEMLEILALLFPFFLVFTVPFALMVACCWVYGRLSADNELSACSSSGINIQSLLIVPLVIGLLAMAMNIFLANWLVPNWALHRFEVLLARHGKDIVYRALKRRGSFTLDPHQIGRRCIIHADGIDRKNDVLHGIGIAVYGKGSSEVEQIITAQEAELHFYSSGKNGQTLDSIAIVPIQATVVMLPEYSYYKAARLRFSGKIRQRIRQKISAMSLSDLIAMGREPELHDSIRVLAREARRIFIACEMVKTLQEARDKHGYFELFGANRRYRFTGRASQPLFSKKGARNILENATIEEYLLDGSEPVRIFADVDQLDLELVESLADTADSGEKASPSALTASMILRNARVTIPQGLDQEQVLEQKRVSLRQLVIPEGVLQRARELSVEQIRQGDFPKPSPPGLLAMGPRINDRMARLTKKVALEIHSRLAIAVACPVLAVLGALLGAIFRKGQFLVAVGLSMIPAMVALLFIIMGQRMVDSQAFSTGMAVGVAWTGLVLLSVANLVLLVTALRK